MDSRILNIGRELYRLSVEKARQLGYEHKENAWNDESEAIMDSSKRIRIARGGSIPGLFGYRSHTWGPELTIDGHRLDSLALTIEDRRVLDAKLEKAFKPLFDALENEKVEAPRRWAVEAEKSHAREVAERRGRHKVAVELVNSLG